MVKHVGKNIAYTLEGSTLTITVDLSKTFGLSSSGKSTIVASSEGNVSLGDADGTKMGLNIYRK